MFNNFQFFHRDTVNFLWTWLPFLSSSNIEDDGRRKLLVVDDSVEFEDTEFHNIVRKYIIILLFFMCLYLLSFWIIKRFKSKSDNDELYAGDEDFLVYRISIWICSCSLATSIGAVTLLPFSILGSEVLQLYPENYYLKWLNWSLINSIWTIIFALSNVALFFLLPFSYFFLESQGLGFSKSSAVHNKSLKSRMIESAIVCFLVLVLLVVFADVINSLNKATFTFSLFNLSLPFVYSLVSLIGVFFLLISTPLGFSKMFDLTSTLLIPSKSEDEENLDDDDVRRLQQLAQNRRENGTVIMDESTVITNGRSKSTDCLTRKIFDGSGDSTNTSKTKFNVTKKSIEFIKKVCNRIRTVFELLKYPVIMLALLILTVLSVSMVLVNTLQLLFGYRALPEYVQYVEVHSRHTFGVIGAVVEAVILMYVMMASLAGVYSLPWLSTHRPKKGATSMTGIIGNCTIVLFLSSALPVLARTLGITSFDLLGAYGRLDWISNFSLIMFYNIFFATLTVLLLVNKFTYTVRKEIFRRLKAITRRDSISSEVRMKSD